MIYRKEEFVQNDPDDSEFPIKQVDRLEAVDGDGQRFIGRAALNMQTPFGLQQIPVSFEVQAESIQSAFEKYAEHARPRIEEVKQHVEDRLEQVQRAEESRIVTPDQDGDILRLNDFKAGH